MLSRKVFVRGAALAVLGVGLASCGFQPVYQGGAAASVGADLRAVEISDPATRLEQAVRNELVFLFTGGDAPAPARYRMQLGVSSGVSNLVIEQATGRPTASSLDLTAVVAVTEIATGAEVLTETFRASASFEQSTQRFANERAKLDAGQRAARDVAERIRIRTAVALRRR